ncbi:MAG: PfkB family carbohydrate kinase [Anaeromicrobium sp.]|jgi:pseudouridine kinase|uniref:PfkB family carbohydrate kinase n=1 Tax=Anaeromicrobium sp. TaxID=1929132 RepID=UPI0025ECD1FE|nr:PfkB family carbohydrate kinase [Anaeromicrobium sp.]MCT4595351.1 PfkB family carbohydrate kinase [Anaeromicrobium sp.]
MTEREREILTLISKNPLISQQDLADRLGIARSSVAVHITNLMKKGYIKGKGYIIRNEEYVTVIGGSNMDISGFPHNKFLLNDSNPGNIKLSLGGVGRNIAENLSKLEIDTKLISPMGDDIYGLKIMEECKKSGIDMNHCLFLRDHPSSTYLSILDENGDMLGAIASMDILDKMSIDFIREKQHIIKNSNVLVLDTNIPADTLYYIASNFKDVPIFIDPVSTAKALKIKDFIGLFHTIKPNKLEAETLSGIKINNNDDLERVCDYFLEKGVSQIFMSLGNEGVYYADMNTKALLPPLDTHVINVTGAGDAFMAGVIHSYVKGYEIKKQALIGSAAASLALSHENTINPNLSINNITKKLKELNL